MIVRKKDEEEAQKVNSMKFEEREKYKIMGNGWKDYYYFDNKLFRISSDGYNHYCVKLYLSQFKSEIEKFEDETAKANEIIDLYGEELHEQEVDYHLQQVIEAIQELKSIDSTIECTIMRNGEVINANNQKKLKR